MTRRRTLLAVAAATLAVVGAAPALADATGSAGDGVTARHGACLVVVRGPQGPDGYCVWTDLPGGLSAGR